MKEPDQREQARKNGLEERAPLIVLIISILLTGASVWAASKHVEERDSLRFRMAIEEVEENLFDRIDSYLGVLWATVGLFQANELNVTDAQLRNFRLAADWGERNTDLAGISFVQKVEPQNREAFEAKHREQVPGFTIHPESDSGELYAVTHVEPNLPHRTQTLGFNPFTDPVRRRALQAAAGSGRVAITDKIVLRADELEQNIEPAVILYAPVYHPGAELLPQGEREHMIYGFVGAGFYLKDLLTHLRRGSAETQIGFQIRVNDSTDASALIAETGSPGKLKRPHQVKRRVEVVGSTWVITYWASPSFYSESASYQVPIVGLVGSLLSLSLFSLAVLQSRARKAHEMALHHQIERARDLEEQDKAKSRFFSNLNHELRTPLNGILGMSDLLYDTPLDSTQKDYLNSIGACAKSLLDLISDVLDMSKVNAGKMELHPAPVELKKVFEQALQVVRGPAQGKGVELFFEWDEVIPEWAQVDAVRLRQILINLLGNAVKFTPEGSVTLRANLHLPEEGAEVLHFEVQDTGIGISESDAEKLFRAFSQVSNGGLQEQKGTGLGLHLCRELLKMMGGSISVESELGVGTTFRCTLPLVDLDSNPFETQTIPDAGAHLNSCLRILVVDDNPINRRVLTLQLEKLGHNTEAASGGEEAVRSVREGDFDLVLMDCQMPVVDGLEATRRIREDHAERPVILALTAYAEDAQKRACMEAGMNDFLTKPVDASKLQAAIQKLAAGVVREDE